MDAIPVIKLYSSPLLNWLYGILVSYATNPEVKFFYSPVPMFLKSIKFLVLAVFSAILSRSAGNRSCDLKTF